MQLCCSNVNQIPQTTTDSNFNNEKKNYIEHQRNTSNKLIKIKKNSHDNKDKLPALEKVNGGGKKEKKKKLKEQ